MLKNLFHLNTSRRTKNGFVAIIAILIFVAGLAALYIASNYVVKPLSNNTNYPEYNEGEITITYEEETDVLQLESSLKQMGLDVMGVSTSLGPLLYFKTPPEGIEIAMNKIETYPEVEYVDHNRDYSVSVMFKRGVTKSQALAVIDKEGYSNLLVEIFTYPFMYVKSPVGQEEQYIARIKDLPNVVDAKRTIKMAPAIGF